MYHLLGYAVYYTQLCKLADEVVRSLDYTLPSTSARISPTQTHLTRQEKTTIDGINMATTTESHAAPTTSQPTPMTMPSDPAPTYSPRTNDQRQDLSFIQHEPP